MKNANVSCIGKKCTGCKMCADICPVDAINFEINNEGFWYPVINEKKCINCNKCVVVCPSLNEKLRIQQKEPIVYAAWSEDEKTRISSTSGGVFYEVAKIFIKQGGVVAGCAYGDDWKSAYHMIATNINELDKIKGSKYFQSDTKGIYKAVEEQLKSGKEVLFCGTPCQCTSLKAYLNNRYEKIYYMDFICRSINSPLAFQKYISELEEDYGAKATEVQLKNKKYGWQSLASKVVFENGKESIRDRNTDWWVKGFINNDLYTRESCYQCVYKKLPRITADITIGDFWGIKNQSKENMFKGISVILLNNERGIDLFERCKNSLILVKKTIADVLPGNPALLNNPIKTSKQDKFFHYIYKMPFSKAVKKCVSPNLMDNFKRGCKYMLKKVKYAIWIIRNCNVYKFIYYNFLSKQIIRDRNYYLIPYKNAVIDLHKTAKIYIEGRNLEIGINKLKGSRAETHLRMREGAVWKAKNGGCLFYNTVLEIHKNALFESGFFTMNGGSVIICAKHINFGEDVMLGRNIVIYDSDYHQVLDENGNMTNFSKEVIIKDHVWLTNQVMVLKGVTIGKSSLVTPYSVVRKDIPEESMYSGNKVVRGEIHWSRDCVKDIG